MGGSGFRSAGGRHRIDFNALTGSGVTVYGQTEITRDLFEARDAAGGIIVHEAEDVTPHDVETHAPWLTYRKGGAIHRVDCGLHRRLRWLPRRQPAGRSRLMSCARTRRSIHSAGWGCCRATPPVTREVTYNHHERGFALCSMRSTSLSRYYVQCSLDDDIGEWPDERFWDELRRRPAR